MFDANNLLKAMQEMGKTVSQAGDELTKLEVSGEAGGGLVKIILNGDYECRSLKIDPELLKEDVEMISDLIAAAFCDASRRVKEAKKEKISALTGGLPIPPNLY